MEHIGSQPYSEVPCTYETCAGTDEEDWWIDKMLEDHVEKSHQDMDKFHQRVATLRSYEMRAKSYSHHEKAANDLAVLAAGKRAIDKTSRKRKHSSLTPSTLALRLHRLLIESGELLY